MEDMDKTIEVVKAAMEKEKKAKQAEESMNEKIDDQTENFNDNEKKLQENTGANDKLKGDELKEQTEDTKDEQKVSRDENVSDEGKETEKGSKDQETSGDEPATAEDASGEKNATQSGSFFKSSKNKESEAKDQKIQELTDKVLRIMAEFDNYRKRTEKEKSQMFDLGVKSVIEKLLPVVDNFERGLGSVSEADKDNAFVQGFNMIYKQLISMLDDIGVKPIEAVGKPFDPNYHNAVMHTEDENLGENIVAEEFQKGYMYKDMIVRHSMVRVVN